MMTRYLLGQATEDECVEIEDRYLRDAEFLRLLQALEAELIDDYVRGELTQVEVHKFEQRLLASPQGRDQLARARKLQANLDRIVNEENAECEMQVMRPESLADPVHKDLWQAFKHRIGFSTPVSWLQYAMAGAALLFFAAGMLMLRENSIARRELARLASERDALKERESNLLKELTVQQDANRKAHSQLEEERERAAIEHSRIAKLQREVGQLHARSSGPSAPAPLIEMALTSGIERNSGDPRKLNIPANVRTVRLQLELDPSTSHRNYRVEVSTAGGAQVWAKAGLGVQRADWGRFVTIDLPARILQAGEYELILRGLKAPREGEIAGYYYFIAVPSPASQSIRNK